MTLVLFGGTVFAMRVGKWKQACTAVALAGFFLTSYSSAARAASHPSPTAQGAILIDGNTGQILYGRDIRGEFYPASITKIMTAYLAITHGWRRTVVVSKTAELQPGSSAYLLAGQRLPMPKVVTAMMMVSGNDAAYAIAQTVSGSVPAFVRLMNAQAKAWHAPGIHFDNPDGLPDHKHVVSALGMAVIAEHAMRNPIFARIVDTHSSVLPPDPRPRVYYNQNQLLYNYSGAVGIKIGYTVEADETIVGAARRHGLFLIEVLLHDTPTGLWPDAQNLLTWGFDHYHNVVLLKAGQRVGTVQRGGRAIPVVSGKTVVYAASDGDAPPIQITLRPSHPDSRAAIKRHRRVGRAVIYSGDKLVAAIPLLSARHMAAAPPRVSRDWWWMILPLVIGISLLGGLVRKSSWREIHYG